MRQVLVVLIAGVVLQVIFGQAQSPMVEAEQGLAEISTAEVLTFAHETAVRGAWSQLIRTDNGVAMSLRTFDLDPGGAYTVWWVIFNTPQGCSPADDGMPVCGEDDIFDARGRVSPNPDATISVTWAASNVISDDGFGNFSGWLQKGQAMGEVLFGPGLVDPRGAEVHLVVRSHGRASTYRNALYTQLNSSESRCRACVDQQFSIHMPAEHMADPMGPEGARSPSPADARAYFVDLADGDAVTSPLVVQFGLEGMEVVPAGTEAPDSGHHHLLIDTDVAMLDLNAPLPSTETVRHFGQGQTEATLELEPGTYTLQLLLGNHSHIPHDPPVMSEKITVIVGE